MKLRKLSCSDRGIIDEYLNLSEHELSVYNFANIYIWRGLFEIYWGIIEGGLCIFFRDKLGCFLYLAPLSRKLKPQCIRESFRIMDNFNSNREISRIENIEEEGLGYYRDLGYVAVQKSADYLCPREALSQLQGNNFKSKRASVNYFLKHHDFQYLPFKEGEEAGCLKLYGFWARQRGAKSQDAVYRGMLEDSFNSFKILLKDFRHLNCIGRIIKIEREIKGFTFGFKLNKDTFCILYEVTDLSVCGLAQFIFREFCRELEDYKYINIMDDSGLGNLRKVKLSYRPVKLIPAYIVKRPDEQAN